jgi:hypothetical protein
MPVGRASNDVGENDTDVRLKAEPLPRYRVSWRATARICCAPATTP